MKRIVVAALLAVSCLAVSGCGTSLLSSGDQGFVSGNGDVKIVPTSDRRAPDPISGTTIDGKQVSLDDLEGRIVVMPVWGSWCGPCRVEAPMLEAASQDLQAKNVAFLGINVRDENPGRRDAFVRNTGITYPSLDNTDGSLLLNFNAGMTPGTIPSVAFIDPQGRVAAVVLGEISRTTLYDVIEEIQS